MSRKPTLEAAPRQWLGFLVLGLVSTAALVAVLVALSSLFVHTCGYGC